MHALAEGRADAVATMLRRLTLLSSLSMLATSQSTCARPHGVERISLAHGDLASEMPMLEAALDGVQIVLLGENGHGVKELTQAKLELVEWLHRDHGFDLVVFESGLFECDLASRMLGEIPASKALKACLRYPFEHAEALPLFESMKAQHGAPGALTFSGMDFQSQGFDSDLRPAETVRRLWATDSLLARRVARADSSLFLVPRHGGLGDSLYAFAFRHADSLKADYRRAADLTTGTASLVFRLAEGWVDRLAIRGRAELADADRLPPRYHELRDEWMARAVSALADSMGQSRRVIVWLHNDHARYGRSPAASDSIRSTGGYLREWYGDEVFSIGFFFGRGVVADNARRPRVVAPIPDSGLEAYLSRGPSTYLVLRGNDRPDVASWASTEQPYLRMGTDTLTLTPAREFDALFFIDSVSVPSYDVR